MKKQTNIVLVTVSVFIATFMTAIEGTIVTTAMPTIIGSLHGMEIMNWVFSIYLLASAIMTPIYGKLADKYGRKPVFLLGILIFIIGSALCGLSDEMLTLVISRGIQGIGAGAIMPVALTIIADLYPIEKRARILGLNSAAWGIASVFGPMAGGVIVDTVGWHWIFFINVPIGIGLIFLTQLFFIEVKTERATKPLDIFGCLTLMGTLLALLLGFQLLGDQGVSFSVLGLFGLTVILVLLFLRAEKRADDPVIDLQLFANPTFVVVNIAAALTSGYLMGIDVYIPMWMQGVLGKSAGIGGLVLAPLSIIWMLGSFAAGRLLVKYSINRALLQGLGITLIGAIALVVIPQTTPFWLFFVVASVLGLGFGITITTTTVGAQSSVAHDQLGVATSFNTLSRTIGQTVMVAVFGIIMNLKNQQGMSQLSIAVDTDSMNQLINPQTALTLPASIRLPLRTVLFDSLHVVYLAGLLLVIAAILLSFFVRSKKA